MPRGNTANLLAAATRKSENAHSRADTAIRALIKTGQPINFRSVARASGCSIDFLYKSPSIRSRIEQLRLQQSTTPPADRPLDTGDSGIVHTLTAQLNELRRRHHLEVTELRAALAAAHGELLALKRSHGHVTLQPVTDASATEHP